MAGTPVTEKIETPTVAVTGITKAHAMRAIARLRNRSVLAYYQRHDKSLNAWVLKTGAEATRQALKRAIEETRT